MNGMLGMLLVLGMLVFILSGCAVPDPCGNDPRGCIAGGPLGNDANGEDPNAAEGGGSDQ